MKLKFEKNEIGEIFVRIGEKDFSTADYIKMIEEVKDKKKITAEFGENISEEDQNSVNSMLIEINSIGKKDSIKKEESDEEEEQISAEDIPF